MIDEGELQRVLLQVQRVVCISSLSLKALSRVNEFVLFLYLDQYAQLLAQKLGPGAQSELSAAQLYLKYRGQPLASLVLQEVRGARGSLARSARELARIVESSPAALLTERFEELIERAVVLGRKAFDKIPPVELQFDFAVSGKLDYPRHQRLYEDIFRLLMTGGSPEMLQEVIAKKNETEASAKIQKIENRMKPRNCSLSESALNYNLELQKKLERRTNFKLLVAQQVQRQTARVLEVLTAAPGSRCATHRAAEPSPASERPASARVSIEARKQVQVFPGRKSAARATSLDREESSAAESEARADRSHLRQLEHFKSGTFYSSLVRKPRHVRVQSCRGSRPASQTASRSDAAQKVDLIISKIDLLTGENDRVRKAVDQAASSWREFGEALQVKEKIFREYALDGRELA